MNIQGGTGYPSSSLSNFAPHKFILDGVMCASMEGFLQALKFKDASVQIEVCKLVGRAAKAKGTKKNWKQSQTLYWQGVEYKRKSQEYQKLLDRAYDALFQNDSFRKALKATQNAVLTHTIGKTKESETVLTRQEFCSRLTKLRERLDK